MVQRKYNYSVTQCNKNASSDEHDAQLSVAKEEIRQKWEKRMEKEKEMVSEHLLNSLTEVGRAEMTENVWMKKEVYRQL